MAKRVPPLSSTKISKLKPNRLKTIELIDGAVPGLRVRMSPTGVMTWSLNIRDARGERRRFDVGQGLGLAAARDKADKLRRQIRDGKDPTAEKKAARDRAKAAQAGIGTFGSIIAAYFETGPGKLLDTGREQLRRIRHVLAKHLERPAAEISPAELQLAVDQHRSASSAGHAVAYIRPVAAWASRRDLMKRGFDELERPSTRHNAEDAGIGQRVLSVEELGKILPKLTRRGHDAAARFILWSGCRLEEACGATWGEIDFERGTWTIPSSRRKDTRRSKIRKKQVQQPDHVVFLPTQAIGLLKAIGPGKPDDLIFRGDRDAKLQNWDRWSKATISVTGVVDWDRHALRRTTATMAGELGAPPHVISALLGHRNIGDQLTAGYSKARYAAEVGSILQLVADRLDAIKNGQDNIVLLRRPAWERNQSPKQRGQR
jgi:integrase